MVAGALHRPTERTGAARRAGALSDLGAAAAADVAVDGPTSSPRRGASSPPATARQRWSGGATAPRSGPGTGRRALPGSAALFVAGAAAGAVLAWWCRTAVDSAAVWWFSLAAVRGGAAAAAVSRRSRSGSTTTSPFRSPRPPSCGRLARQRGPADRRRSRGSRRACWPSRCPLNTLVAWAGYVARTVSPPARSSARLIGTIIFVCAGWRGWVLLIATFLCAAVTSRLGLRRKTLLGIAEERGGRRGAGNAIANTGVAAVAAVLAVVTYAHTGALDRLRRRTDGRGSDTVPARSARRGGGARGRSLPLRPVPPGTPGRDVARRHRGGAVGAAALAALAASRSA